MQRESNIFTDVQTRSDCNRGKWTGTRNHRSVADAYNAWKQDKHIWKRSFISPTSRYRFRIKYHSPEDLWGDDTEAKFAELNPTYINAAPTDIFWVNQKVASDDLRSLCRMRDANVITQAEFDRLHNLGCIEEVLTDAQFRAKYCV